MEHTVGTFYGVSVGPGDPARLAGYFTTIIVKE